MIVLLELPVDWNFSGKLGDGDRLFGIQKRGDFCQRFKELNKNYVDEIDPAELMRIGIDAMVSSLDPFTNYISESQVEALQDFR